MTSLTISELRREYGKIESRYRAAAVKVHHYQSAAGRKIASWGIGSPKGALGVYCELLFCLTAARQLSGAIMAAEIGEEI